MDVPLFQRVWNYYSFTREFLTIQLCFCIEVNFSQKKINSLTNKIYWSVLCINFQQFIIVKFEIYRELLELIIVISLNGKLTHKYIYGWQVAVIKLYYTQGQCQWHAICKRHLYLCYSTWSRWERWENNLPLGDTGRKSNVLSLHLTFSPVPSIHT